MRTKTLSTSRGSPIHPMKTKAMTSLRKQTTSNSLNNRINLHPCRSSNNYKVWAREAQESKLSPMINSRMNPINQAIPKSNSN